MNLLPFRALVPTLPFGSDATALFARSKFAYQAADFRRYEAEPTYFIYRHTDSLGTDRSVLIGLIDLADWEEQRVLPHEETLIAKENQQIQLTRERASCVKPVLLTYEATPERTALAAAIATPAPAVEPIVDLREAAADFRHRVYAITDTAQRDKIHRLLTEDLRLAYVADGHHRLNTTYRMWREEPDGDRYRYLLTGIIAPRDLTILSHYRVVRIDRRHTTRIRRALEDFFYIRPYGAAALPPDVGYWSFFYRDQCYELRWKELTSELDVARFNREVLPPIFGIDQVKATDRMSYWEGDFTPAAITDRLRDRADLMVFCPYPLDRATFFDTVEPGRLLPPKSTRFEPRMPNGLIVQAF